MTAATSTPAKKKALAKQAAAKKAAKAPTEKPPAKKTKEKKEIWQNSKSKALLRAGILAGTITPEMKPMEVRNMAPDIHAKWKHSSWSQNLRTLQNAIGRDRGRMEDDAKSFEADMKIVKQKRLSYTHLPWHLSAATRLLKKDVDDGVDKTMKPQQLYNSRPEYQEFTLEVFRKHIYQERDCRPKREIRFARKLKKLKYPELMNPDHPRLRNGELDYVEGEEPNDSGGDVEGQSDDSSDDMIDD